MRIRFQAHGAELVSKSLAKLPRDLVKVALPAFVQYIVGNTQHGLKHSEPYRYVPRKAAYGKSFFSPAQQRYVMARIQDGSIVPGEENRSGESEVAWGYRAQTSERYLIENPTAGAYYTRSDTGQARQLASVGWWRVVKVIQANFDGAIRVARMAVSAYVKANRK